MNLADIPNIFLCPLLKLSQIFLGPDRNSGRALDRLSVLNFPNHESRPILSPQSSLHRSCCLESVKFSDSLENNTWGAPDRFYFTSMLMRRRIAFIKNLVWFFQHLTFSPPNIDCNNCICVQSILTHCVLQILKNTTSDH